MSTALIVVIYGAAFVGFFGSLFVIGSLILGGRADDAAEDLSDRLAHGDIIRLPPVVSSFHDRGL